MKQQLRTVHLAPARDGGLYAFSDKGTADAPELCAIVYPSPSEIRRALGILRRHFPAYRMDGAELRIYGRIKQAKGTK